MGGVARPSLSWPAFRSNIDRKNTIDQRNSMSLIFVHDIPYISYWRCYIKSASLYDIEGPIILEMPYQICVLYDIRVLYHIGGAI